MKVLCFKVNVPKNCCLCIKARSGAYIIAILGIVYGILSLSYILFCFDDITKKIGQQLQRVDKDISNIQEVYMMYCCIATTILSTINSCFLLLGLYKNSPILLTTWLIIAGIGNWVCVHFKKKLTHYIQPSFTRSKWNMGETCGLNFHL
jgi:hypothetical protein